MKKTTLCLALSLACAQHAMAAEFRVDRLYILGDSLSDGGTYTNTATAGLTGAGVPSALIPNRLKFTTNSNNSPLWDNVLAAKLGIPLDVDVLNIPTGTSTVLTTNVNGGNYAQGGSRVANPAGISQNLAQGITTIPVTQQVDRLLADVGGTFQRTDLVALWAGANDGFTQFGTIAVAGAGYIPTALSEMSVAAGAELQQIDRLKAAGARNIVVITMPDLGVTPFAALVDASSPGSKTLLTTLTNQFNNTLETAAAAKGAVVVDANKLLYAILANPAKYGFTSPTPTTPACGVNASATGPNDYYNSSLTCIQGVNASADSQQRIFADGVHPTAAAQALFGEAGFAGLQATGINGILQVSPLTPIRQHALGLENRLSSFALVEEDPQGKVKLRPVGDVQVYASAEAGQFNSSAQQVQEGLQADTKVLNVGADRMVARNALVGVGVSLDSANTKFDNNGGGFKNDVAIGTLFTTVALSKSVYVNAALAYGRISYDVERKFMLGPSQERYTANTNADYQSARIGGGYIHSFGNGWTVNPQLAYTDEQIKLDGYNESSGAASLSFGSSTYKAQRVSTGFALTKAPANPSGWRPLLRFSIETDLNKDDVAIRMGPNPNTLATVYAPRPDGNFQLLSVGAAKPVGPGQVILQAASTLGQQGVKSLSLSASYKASF